MLDRRSNNNHLIVETKDPLIAERLFWEFINEGAFFGEERK